MKNEITEEWIIHQMLDLSIGICEENYTNKFDNLHVVGLKEVVKRMKYLIKYAEARKERDPLERNRRIKKAKVDAANIRNYKLEYMFK